jgi:hypothetical protein
MIETLGGGILGGLLGGVFRLAPEVVKYFDRKDERRHELSMFERQCELEQVRGQIKLQEINATRESVIDSGVVDALNNAIQQQADMVKSAGPGWVANLSASVRPVITYYLLALYGVVKACFMVMAFDNGMPLAEVVVKNWTVDDATLLAGVVNYWMIDRTLGKRGL